jgi:hypothetical protein
MVIQIGLCVMARPKARQSYKPGYLPALAFRIILRCLLKRNNHFAKKRPHL